MQLRFTGWLFGCFTMLHQLLNEVEHGKKWSWLVFGYYPVIFKEFVSLC
jgi:hypothetical protein